MPMTDAQRDELFAQIDRAGVTPEEQAMAEQAMPRLRGTKPWPQGVTIDLAWSTRAFNMGLGVGVLIGGMAGVLFGIWIFQQLY